MKNVPEHFVKVIETEVKGVSVNVWKPDTMERLPAYRLREVLGQYAGEIDNAVLTGRGAFVRWEAKNPDYGIWDAQVCVRFDRRRKALDVFFCSILVRPFSREAMDRYEAERPRTISTRLQLGFDSRVFDREGGYRRVYGFSSASSPDDKVYEELYIEHAPADIAENLNPSRDA